MVVAKNVGPRASFSGFVAAKEGFNKNNYPFCMIKSMGGHASVFWRNLEWVARHGRL